MLCRCTGDKIIDAVLALSGPVAAVVTPAAGANVGSAIRHLDGQPKVDGTLCYGADQVPVDALAVRIIRSPHHHARFVIGDKSGFVAATQTSMKSWMLVIFRAGIVSGLFRRLLTSRSLPREPRSIAVMR